MAEEKKEFNQIAYQNQFIKDKYDRIQFLVPKGEKEKIKAYVKEQGKSMNQFMCDLIKKEMGE